jgi:hypothetical protein
MTGRPWPGLPEPPVSIARHPGWHELARLRLFYTAHPGVLIGPGALGTWQAVIPEPAGETFAARTTLGELLDRLDALLGGR